MLRTKHDNEISIYANDIEVCSTINAWSKCDGRVRTTKKIPRILWNWWWNEKRIRYTCILFLVFLNENYMTQRTKTITHYRNANLLLENLSSESNLFETLVWRLLLLLLVVGGYFCLFLHLTNALLLFIFVPWSQSKCVFYKHTHFMQSYSEIYEIDLGRKFLFILILRPCIILISFHSFHINYYSFM